MAEIFDPGTGEVIEGPLPPNRMVELYAKAIQEVERFQAMAGKLEFYMLQYMEANQATAIPHDQFNVTVVQANSYDRTLFKPLLEIFNAVDLDKCYTAAYSQRVDVEESWNTQQVKAAGKRYGTKALDIIEGAATLGPRRLKFEAIEKTPKD